MTNMTPLMRYRLARLTLPIMGYVDKKGRIHWGKKAPQKPKTHHKP